jgi:lincosamide nucleotidyltransferase A/C/D/E
MILGLAGIGQGVSQLVGPREAVAPLAIQGTMDGPSGEMPGVRVVTAEDVTEIMSALGQQGVAAWLDGGWGVDALVGHQTRPHGDLDLVISLEDANSAIDALARLGFDLHDDERPTRFVLSDSHHRSIDFHTVTFDGEGGGIQQLQDGNSYRYPPHGFQGKGHVNVVPLPCLIVDVQVECHLGYEPSETDRHDLRLLASNFGVELPEPYR